MGIDLTDISKYPRSVMDAYQEKKKYDAYIEKKTEKITGVEDNFHKFVNKRIVDTAELRKKRGLRIREEE